MSCLYQDWPGDLKPVSFLFLLQHLSISNGNIQVDASFMQTLWNVHPTCSGSSIEEGVLFFICISPLPASLSCALYSDIFWCFPVPTSMSSTQHDFSLPQFFSLVSMRIIFCPDFWLHEHSWHFLILCIPLFYTVCIHDLDIYLLYHWLFIFIYGY